MKNQIKKFLPVLILKCLRIIKNILSDVYSRKSYSQEGEDMILNRIFEGRQNGFYVDVGAHHPRRFSNTCFFYKRGWSGINIEPNPEALATFEHERKRDINIQCGISDSNGLLKYFYFDDPALNTFDPNLVDVRLSQTQYKVIKIQDIAVVRLAEILTKHLPENKRIDFLSVDVEGLDLNVLKSNDWDKFRPCCVLVEVLDVTLEAVVNTEIYKYMIQIDYVLFSKTQNTLIFRAN